MSVCGSCSRCRITLDDASEEGPTRVCDACVVRLLESERDLKEREATLRDTERKLANLRSRSVANEQEAFEMMRCLRSECAAAKERSEAAREEAAKGRAEQRSRIKYLESLLDDEKQQRLDAAEEHRAKIDAEAMAMREAREAHESAMRNAESEFANAIRDQRSRFSAHLEAVEGNDGASGRRVVRGNKYMPMWRCLHDMIFVFCFTCGKLKQKVEALSRIWRRLKSADRDIVNAANVIRFVQMQMFKAGYSCRHFYTLRAPPKESDVDRKDKAERCSSTQVFLAMAWFMAKFNVLEKYDELSCSLTVAGRQDCLPPYSRDTGSLASVRERCMSEGSRSLQSSIESLDRGRVSGVIAATEQISLMSGRIRKLLDEVASLEYETTRISNCAKLMQDQAIEKKRFDTLPVSSRPYNLFEIHLMRHPIILKTYVDALTVKTRIAERRDRWRLFWDWCCSVAPRRAPASRVKTTRDEVKLHLKTDKKTTPSMTRTDLKGLRDQNRSALKKLLRPYLLKHRFKRAMMTTTNTKMEDEISNEMSDDRRVDIAMKLKEQGNQMYKKGEYKESLAKYAEAVDVLLTGEGQRKKDPALSSKQIETVAVLHVNIAAAYMQQNNWMQVVEHASKAMSLDPQDTAGVRWKALYRRGTALKHLKRYNQAIIELTGALTLKPDYRAAQKQIGRIKAILESKNGIGDVGLPLPDNGDEEEKKRESAPPLPEPLKTIIGLTTRKVGINEFRVEGDLGEGNFSNVLKARHKKTNEVFALKTIEIKKVKRLRIRHPNIDNEIMMEKTVLAKLNHPGIIKLYHTFKDATNLYFLLEYCPGGEVWKALKRFDEMIGCTPTVARFYAAQIVSTLAYLRSQGIVHRDLKPENMMLTATGHVKLVDLGTAKDLRDEKYNGNEFVGTPEYMSPAALKDKDSTCDADLWSLGSVIYQLHTGYPPFKALSPFLAMQKAVHRQIFFPDFFPDDARDLVTKLLVWNPSERIGSGSSDNLDAIRKHPYFAGTRWATVHTDPPPIQTLADICLNDHVLSKPWKYRGYATMKPAVRGYIMHVLQRRKRLLLLHKYFFSSPAAANCCRARNRRYLGLQRRGEDEFEGDFSFAVISRPAIDTSARSREHLRAIVKRINAMDPLPRVAIVLGPLTASAPGDTHYEAEVAALHETLAELQPKVMPMFAGSTRDMTFSASADVSGSSRVSRGLESYRKNFGDDFFSTWFGGVKLVVLNGPLMAAGTQSGKDGLRSDCDYSAMERWLKYELYVGSLCTQHMVVLANHDFEFPVPRAKESDRMRMLFERMKKKKVLSLLTASRSSHGKDAVEIMRVKHLAELSASPRDEATEADSACDAEIDLTAEAEKHDDDPSNQSDDEDAADIEATEGKTMKVVRFGDCCPDSTLFLASVAEKHIKYKRVDP
eukprot:g2261.t1